MHRSVVLASAPLFTLLVASAAVADPPRKAKPPSRKAAAALEEGALGLLEQKVAPDRVAADWKRAGLDPDQALDGLRARRPKPDLPAGVHTIPLQDGLGRASEAFVRVPSAAPGERGYSVFVFLHGIGGNSKGQFERATGLAPKDAIVIGPTALEPTEASRPEDLSAAFALAGSFVNKQFPRWWSYQPDGFVMRALREVRRRFPVDGDRVLLLGYSMGGFGAWNVGLRYHDQFAGVVPMAGGVSRQEYIPLGRDRRSRSLLGNARMVPLYFAHGDRDEVVPVHFDRWTAAWLKEQHLPFTYQEVPGGRHILDDFKKGQGPLIDGLIEWLGAQNRDAHPARVEHHAIGDYHGGAFWLKVDALAGEEAHVVALARREQNALEVVAEGTKALSIYLDPALIDVQRPARITINGKLVHEGLVAPSLDVVAESYARTGDPALAYARALKVELPSDLPRPQAADWKLGLE